MPVILSPRSGCCCAEAAPEYVPLGRHATDSSSEPQPPAECLSGGGGDDDLERQPIGAPGSEMTQHPDPEVEVERCVEGSSVALMIVAGPVSGDVPVPMKLDAVTSIAQVHDALLQKFELAADVELAIYYWDVDFDEFINLTVLTDLPMKAKLDVKLVADDREVDSGSEREEETQDTNPASVRFTAQFLVRGGSWSLAVEQNGFSQTGAVVRAVGLLFWHWIQPVTYFVVLAIFSREIDDVQYVLGCLVAVREAIYLISSIACLWLCPAYLLVDVYASVHLNVAADVNEGHVMDDFGFGLMSTGGMPFLGLSICAHAGEVPAHRDVLAVAAVFSGGHEWLRCSVPQP